MSRHYSMAGRPFVASASPPLLFSIPSILLLLLLSLLFSSVSVSGLIVYDNPSAGSSVGPLELPHQFPNSQFSSREPDPNVGGPLVEFESLASSLSLPHLPEMCTVPALNASILESFVGHVFLIRRSYPSEQCNFDTKVGPPFHLLTSLKPSSV